MDTNSPISSPWPAFQPLEQRAMPARSESVAQMMAWLEQVGEERSWPPKSVFALTLCADEALTNIVSHAKPADDAALQIKLQLGMLDGGIALCLADNGREFDPTQQASAELAESLDEAEVGGHGLRLMRHYLQRFEYRRSDGWNCLLMVVASQDKAS
ncbi:ATP-binding protein [Comamonas testosteroni]|uniref:ATP-binding protein n=1 Tax=Comamonas testosteroni TaxID=285 RepID=A0A373FQM8_COMTE|nr:ATP-binding protein [Comamonas testosteroni]RGE45669.1 ATP-binding protein [Comamonas testosteroni]